MSSWVEVTGVFCVSLRTITYYFQLVLDSMIAMI